MPADTMCDYKILKRLKQSNYKIDKIRKKTFQIWHLDISSCLYTNHVKNTNNRKLKLKIK